MTSTELDRFAYTLAFASPQVQSEMLQTLQAQAAREGVFTASIGAFYSALASGQSSPATVPAFNLRGLTYTVARSLWRVVMRLNAGPVIFELAPSESRATRQTFTEYAAMVLAAALREGYKGPVFLQGDHFSLYQDSPQDRQTLQQLCQEAVEVGFYQIDLDASALSNPQSGDAAAAQAPNASATAQLVSYVRGLPNGHRVCLGGEVGEIGSANTSAADILAFMQNLAAALPNNATGIQKISIQNGTTHGGLVGPDGQPTAMPIDLELTHQLSQMVRRELGLAGIVQHGASTLAIQQLAQLPTCGVIEVHLATGIQNRIFDHPAFPQGLLQRMQQELVGQLTDAESGRVIQDQGLSLQQRFYSARWKAWGQYKPELWALDEDAQAALCQELEKWFEQVLAALRVSGRRAELLKLYGGS